MNRDGMYDKAYYAGQSIGGAVGGLTATETARIALGAKDNVIRSESAFERTSGTCSLLAETVQRIEQLANRLTGYGASKQESGDAVAAEPYDLTGALHVTNSRMRKYIDEINAAAQAIEERL